MANYYHEARAHVRSLKGLEVDNKRRAERRAEIANAQADHPLDLLSIDGRQLKLYKNAEQYQAAERGEGLVPWNGEADNMIDRFDGRALLDILKEYDPETAPKKKKTAEEERLQKILVFESYRDLVRLTSRGLTEREGLAAAAAENLEIRAAARASAVAGQLASGQQQTLPGTAAAPAGQGAYSAVGFSYGTAESSSDSEDDDDDGDADQGDHEGGEEGAQEQSQADKEDDIAFERFGIEDFAYRLHKALEQEGEQAALMGKRPRRSHGKKKARERARRMAGQGCNIKDWRDPTNATSVAQRSRNLLRLPDMAKRSASRSPTRSKSTSPVGGRLRDNKPRTEFITEFRGAGRAAASGRDASFSSLLPGATRLGSGQQSLDRKAFERDDNILEALPDLPDPAMVSTQPLLTDLVTIHGIKPSERRYDRHSSRSRSRDRSYRHRSRSRSRSRGHRRSRSRSRGRGHHRSRSRDRGRSRSRSRGRHGSRRSRSRSRERGRQNDEFKGSAKGTVAASGAGTVAAAIKVPAATTAAAKGGVAAGPKVETPQERLKRIMAAQLTKQAQKDQTVVHLKKAQVEKEKQARATIEKAVLPRPRSPSPRRGRSRSPRDFYERERVRDMGRTGHRSRSRERRYG